MASKAILRSTVVGIPRRQKGLPGQWQRFMTLSLAALLLVVLCVVPSGAQECACTPCHGTLEEVHGDFNHSAAPGSGPVVIFEDDQHDDAGWVGSKPYFAVVVDCTLCHNTNLIEAHGNDCATCHPTPYDSLGLWGKGCQQGGCHAFYHEDSTQAHLPFEDGYDCNICHSANFAVEQTNCLNCHAAYTPGDVTPPTTTSNAREMYDGPATIQFSITDNGKVGVGRTFYRLDGGPVTAAGNYVLVETPGLHQLEFWSMDQSGNTELVTNQVLFSIVEDTTPPITTSNAQPLYSQGAVITLSATDESTQGVKMTYYQLNDGPVQGGTSVVIPATSGTFDYTLKFWSEDWAGNLEAPNTVSFTVISGTGTIRLVWGNSDTLGSPCPGDPEANAAWTIRRGGSSGAVVASGSASCPSWSGFDDIAVAVSSTTPYYVDIDWWDSDGEFYDNTVYTNVYVTTPGQLVRLSY